MYNFPGGLAPLRYSADGRLLLARANDNTMSLYDVATRQPIGDPIEIGNSDADLRPDGKQVVVSGSDQGGILVWSLDPTVLTPAACDLAGRNLTRPEWAAYLSELESSYHRTCPQFVEPPA